jgi:Xaa-Pro aminopeptidase
MKTPRIQNTFFKGNRSRLLKNLPNNALALLHGAEPAVRGGDTLHPYRQDSNFFYFTGIDTPGCALLLIPDNNGKPEEILFIPPVDPEKEKWEGKMLSIEEAKKISGIETVYDIDTLKTVLFRAQKWREALFCDIPEQFPEAAVSFQHQFFQDISIRLPGLQLKKIAPLAAKQRICKQPPEINQINISLNIIHKALLRVMEHLIPGSHEYEVEADIIYTYLKSGCERVGFDTIAAGGANATVLHYINNSAPLKDGDLILIDTGGEYGMYSGDITRTFPINGEFSERQRFCYEAVLEVQKAVIEKIRPGMTLTELSREAGKIQGDVYQRCGFIEKPEDYAKVGLHGIGHYLGLDIHDVGHPDWPLEEGTIITIEPGLYLKEEGIGIRIEDNILIQKNGIQNLSSAIPKEIESIEAIMRESRAKSNL